MPPHHDDRSPPTLAAYAEGWLARERQAAAEAEAWRSRIRSRLPLLAERLRDEHGVGRILLFGSLARDEAGPGSDLDLMIDGIPMERVIAATVTAERLLCEATVDLVPFEGARPEVRARAEAEGIDL